MKITAGLSQELHTGGRFFQCKTATKPFSLRVFTNRQSWLEAIDEGDTIELPDGERFVKLVFDNTENTDDLTVLFTCSPVKKESHQTRVPPTRLTGSGIVALVDVAEQDEYDGVRNGRRRKQIHIEFLAASGSVYLKNDGNIFYVLSADVRTWTLETDANITVENSSSTDVSYCVGETFHL
jgi:hypothetical protein